MILVDIYVPSIDQTFDFNLDESAPVSDLLDEIGEMVLQIEQGEGSVDMSNLMMGCYETQSVLPKEATLNQCQIRTGNRLFII